MTTSLTPGYIANITFSASGAPLLTTVSFNEAENASIHVAVSYDLQLVEQTVCNVDRALEVYTHLLRTGFSRPALA